jgi:hypothetical protein
VADAEEVARTAFMTETGTVPAIVVARQEGSRAPAAPTVPDPSTGTGTTPV